jgi:hypothetical protein
VTSHEFIMNKLVEKHRVLPGHQFGGTPPIVVRHNRFAPEALFCIFFKTTGPVLIHHVDQGETIDHHYYIDNCLEPLIEEIRKERPKSGTHAIQLHHDNARSYVHKDVSNYLESEGIKIIRHPPNNQERLVKMALVHYISSG